MDRLVNLSENQLVTTLLALRSDLDELKTRQRIAGPGGVLGYDVHSNLPWDLTGTIGTDADTTTITTNFSVVYTGDGSQNIAFMNLSFSVFVAGPDRVLHQLTPTSDTWTDGFRSAGIDFNGTDEGRHIYTVYFDLVTVKAINYYIKGYATASQPGTITASLV